MPIRRRDVLKLAGAAALSGSLPHLARGVDNASLYDLPHFGNARILHLTDTHAQLTPVFFREPGVNIGIGEMLGQPPHLVGRAFLERFGISDDSARPMPSPASRSRNPRSASASSAASRI
jgi:sulfur-oxidizing protein SoxB